MQWDYYYIIQLVTITSVVRSFDQRAYCFHSRTAVPLLTNPITDTINTVHRHSNN